MNKSIKFKNSDQGVTMESKIILNFYNFVSHINFQIFPFLVVIGAAFSVLEGITYQGFVRNYFLFDLKIILLMTFFSGLFVVLFIKVKEVTEPSEYYIFLKNLVVVVIIILLFTTYLLYIRLPVGRNSFLVGANTLIYPNRFLLATVLALYFLIVYNISFGKLRNYVKEKLKIISPQELLYWIVVIFAVTWVAVVNLKKDAVIVRQNIVPVLKYPKASYEWKVRSQVGPIFDYYNFVNSVTPKDALILNPKQQGQWPDVSNQGFTRYFIYPRNLVAEDEKELNRQTITHVFLIGGKKLHDFSQNNRWPEFFVPAKRVIYYPNNKDDRPIIVEGNYDPLNIPYPDFWGIIEVDNTQ